VRTNSSYARLARYGEEYSFDATTLNHCWLVPLRVHAYEARELGLPRERILRFDVGENFEEELVGEVGYVDNGFVGRRRAYSSGVTICWRSALPSSSALSALGS
jgi:hypothetical protein